MESLRLQAHDEIVDLIVKVVPGSRKTALCGNLDGMLKIKVAAPPEKGKANQAVISLLAEVLGIKKTAIEITGGQTHPVKKIQIHGLSLSQVRAGLCS